MANRTVSREGPRPGVELDEGAEAPRRAQGRVVIGTLVVALCATALALVALVATAATAKTVKTNDQDTDRCGNTTLKDPDANVRAEFNRNCPHYNNRQSN